MALTEADAQYFEAMESVFTSPGWRVFKDDILGWQEAISSQWRSMKPEDLTFAQGRYAGLEQVLQHFKLCEDLKAQALEEQLDANDI